MPTHSRTKKSIFPPGTIIGSAFGLMEVQPDRSLKYVFAADVEGRSRMKPDCGDVFLDCEGMNIGVSCVLENGHTGVHRGTVEWE